MKFLLPILIVLSSISISFADSLEDSPSIAKCNEELKRCTYVSQNITARALVSRINSIMFPGSILTPEEGYINVESLKKLNFWLTNEELKTRFIALLPLLDSFEEFNPSALVQLTTEIYSVSEKGFNHMSAQIASATTDTGDATDVVLNTLGGGTIDLALKLGSNLLGSVLGTRVAREEVSQVETVTQLIPNMADINYSHGSTVFVSPTPGIVKEAKAGLNIGGTVSINKFDSELVVLKNYNFNYGVINPSIDGEVTAPVTLLSIQNPQLYLVKDTSTMVVSTHTVREESGREWGLGLFGRSKDKLRTKLMVVTRATAYSFQDYIRQLKKLRRLDLHRSFSELEINNFPGDSISMGTVLKSVKPYSLQTPSGQKILGMKIDKSFARKDNIKKSIEVSIKGGGIKQEAILTLENLMLSGIKFNPLGLRYLDKKVIKLKVELKPFRGSRTERVKLKLYYNPRTNSFIQE
ncbi:MAG: hypothetical protein CME70_02145 [Halobacteriovorax sp.]|nr:hypothetical protein [Halobacteriovorax sp.]|tara:strand:- start:39602 stop:41002 length:1401 start_codon:yes stop_codon:yes gene_type:complete